MNAAIQFFAQVDGEQIQGWVAKDGRSFRASADFRGKPIDVRGTSKLDAENKWRGKANHKANE